MFTVTTKTFRNIPNFCKSLSVIHKSDLGLWQEDLNADIKLKIEKHWSLESKHTQNHKINGKYYYVLPMFPYPSGNLHMGHVRVYSISDTIARFQKLNGYNVIHPMGWDAFGLPAENAAIERNIPPHQWTASNIATMKKQLLQMGFNFDWNSEFSTSDPEYYKWTQYIFIKLFENGLAYQSKATVNWDPVDKTVLADEQVDDLGCSWRSGAKVEKKVLKQWFIRTTKFAKQLYDGLDSKNLENWKDIINLQKHWIGCCDGVVVTFKITIGSDTKYFDVWTSEPYKFLHGQFITMSKSSLLFQEIKNNEFKILKALNPITDIEIPIYFTDAIQYPEGRDIYIACPSITAVDKQIAVSLNIPFVEETNETNITEDNMKAVDIAQSKNVGGYYVSSKLKDWLISRQRYWGTPIPIIHCKKCGTVPVPYKELPVKLPEKDHTAKLDPQKLAELNDWVNCKCPKCQMPAKREIDTMDTFVDSSWYFYRFLDPENKLMPFGREKLEGHTPVDMYIGGKEHAVLHLYYARFMSYFLHSLGWTPTAEPFRKLLVQGMVMGQSYKIKSSGKYIPAENVEKVGEVFRDKVSGELVSVQWEKMSKSKHNGENPERLLSLYGCDTTRLLVLSDVPPATSRHWSEATFPGVLNWQKRLWMTMRDFLKYRHTVTSIHKNLTDEEFNNYEFKIWGSRNYFTANTTYQFKHTQMLSVGISRLQGLTSTLRDGDDSCCKAATPKCMPRFCYNWFCLLAHMEVNFTDSNLPPEIIAKSKEFELALASLIIMLTPIAPHFCCELWAGLLSAPGRINLSSPLVKWDQNVLGQSWPRVDDDYELSFMCKVDGADRCELKIKANDLEYLSQEDAFKMMMNEEKVKKRVKKAITKIQYDLYPGCRAILHIFTDRNLEKVKKEI